MRRRELLALAAAAPLAAATAARAQSPQVTALAEAVRAERASATFYASADLPDAVAFAGHEREHADALAGALEAFGGTELPEVDAEALIAALPPDPVKAAIAVEEQALKALDELLQATDETQLLATVASIMAAAGTHLAVLRSERATL